MNFNVNPIHLEIWSFHVGCVEECRRNSVLEQSNPAIAMVLLGYAIASPNVRLGINSQAQRQSLINQTG
ncbi:MAG: hypothetical protein QNJ51_14015 [Calothrix sp. MO_167.B12]|nr:hypothetical protein [Calothrix sp. MO_167.B12]